jgi:pimeloyl-ACP methyl ester carboxylesterase
MGIDWPSLQRMIDVDAPGVPGTQRVNVLDTGTPPDCDDERPALLFLHGWASNWQVFLLTIAAFMETHRVVSLDLPGSARPSCRTARSPSRTTRARSTRSATRWASSGWWRSGNSMGGFIGAELALSSGTRVDRLVLISAAGPLDGGAGARAAVGRGAPRGAGMPLAARFDGPVVHRPRLRRAAMQLVIRYPERLSVPLPRSWCSARASPASSRGSRRCWTTPTATGCGRSRSPCSWCGGATTCWCRSPTRTATPS